MPKVLCFSLNEKFKQYYFTELTVFTNCKFKIFGRLDLLKKIKKTIKKTIFFQCDAKLTFKN